jgi:putative spermidine/putrescine transport system permease protein
MNVTAAPTPRPRRARLSAFFYRHGWLKLLLLLLPPLIWVGVVYLGALASLLAHAFWTTNDLTQEVERSWSLDNFRTLWESDVYRTITLRTVGIAAAVTITDALLAFPLAYCMVRIASPRWRAIMLVGVLMPLWSSYLIRVYTWRLILSDNGFANWTLEKVGLGSVDIAYSMWALWITESYVWLPFMILPVYAALERIPPSLLEASGDLGARTGRTFRRIILPLVLPGVAAGSIFTFSLTLGDYLAPVLVSNTQFIGNVIYINVGVANNLPFAAAFTVVPIVIMAVYLTVVRRMGAFESL